MNSGSAWSCQKLYKSQKKIFSKCDYFYIVSYVFRPDKNNGDVKKSNLFHWRCVLATNCVRIGRFRESTRFWRVWAETTYLMKQIRFFDITIVLFGSKYIGYDVKIITFRKLFFWLLYNFWQLQALPEFIKISFFLRHLPANKIQWIGYHLELRSVNQFAHHYVILVGLMLM